MKFRTLNVELSGFIANSEVITDWEQPVAPTAARNLRRAGVAEGVIAECVRALCHRFAVRHPRCDAKLEAGQQREKAKRRESRKPRKSNLGRVWAELMVRTLTLRVVPFQQLLKLTSCL